MVEYSSAIQLLMLVLLVVEVADYWSTPSGQVFSDNILGLEPRTDCKLGCTGDCLPDTGLRVIGSAWCSGSPRTAHYCPGQGATPAAVGL